MGGMGACETLPQQTPIGERPSDATTKAPAGATWLVRSTAAAVNNSAHAGDATWRKRFGASERFLGRRCSDAEPGRPILESEWRVQSTPQPLLHPNLSLFCNRCYTYGMKLQPLPPVRMCV